jgi:hypothetical protein
MTLRQFDEFQKLWEGQREQEDFRMGSIVAAVYNAAGASNDGRPFTASDFMPKYGGAPEIDNDDIAARVEACALAFGIPLSEGDE